MLSEASWTYNPLQLDAYLLHIADANSHCEAVAVEDIYNSHNHLIVKKDTAITPTVADQMMQFTLAKPLEESIRLLHELDEAKLIADLTSVMKEDDVFFAINEHNDVMSLLASLCQFFSQVPVLRQKLTVMSHVMPEIYQRSLYCTWLSVCVAKEMRLSQDDIAIIFMAALSHDIGMLHIDSKIIRQTATLSPNDWVHIQRHVVISYQLLKAMNNIPDLVAEAVYEHHEQCDGTGYPLGKLDNELKVFGKIISLTDSVIASYFHHYKRQGHCWREVIPLIHFNTQAYMSRAYELLLAIVRRSELPIKNVVHGDETPEFIENVLHRNEQLKLWLTTMRDSFLSVGFRHGDRRLHTLQNVMLRVATSAEGSGIFNSDKIVSLVFSSKTSSNGIVASSLSPDGSNHMPNDVLHDASKSIEDMHLIQEEIIFHLQRLNRMTQLYLESGECKNDEIKSALTLGLTRAKQC